MGTHTHMGMGIEYVDEAIDLRRKRNSELVNRIIRRADWLDAPDRELILAYFDRGLSAARISAINGSDPRNIRRRVRRLIARLNDPRVAYVVAHSGGWGRSRCSVARELFLRGRSMRETSQKLGISLHSVRKHRDAIEAMALAEQEKQRPSRRWQHAERGVS